MIRTSRGRGRERRGSGMSVGLPEPRLTRVYRLEAMLVEPLDLCPITQGTRRIVPLTGGTFSGPELNGGADRRHQRRLAGRPPGRDGAR